MKLNIFEFLQGCPTLKRAMTPEWLEKRTNNQFLPKIMTYCNTCKLCSHRCSVSTWSRDAVVRDRDQNEALGSRDRDFEKRVSRRLDVELKIFF